MSMTPPFPEEIILFSRYPRPGRVKTRLIPGLGEEGAARLHRFLAERTLGRALEAARRRPAGITLCYTGGSRQEMTDWLGPAVSLLPQEGQDLGARMAAAFRTAWTRGVQRAVLIGSDCPGLSPELINAGLAALTHHDLVLGPASDGGYYLIGQRSDLAPPARDALFTGIAWGSASVRSQTLARAATLNLSVSTLQELHDIDRPEDLPHLGHYPDPQ